MEGFYVSHTAKKKEGNTGELGQKMKDLLQMGEETLALQGVWPLPETLAIIVDFFRNVKGNKRQKNGRIMPIYCAIRLVGRGDRDRKGDKLCNSDRGIRKKSARIALEPCKVTKTTLCAGDPGPEKNQRTVLSAGSLVKKRFVPAAAVRRGGRPCAGSRHPR